MTMVELLVVMAMFSGLLTIVYGVLITIQHQTADTVRRADAVDQARIGLAEIDRQVRSGNVLYDPASTDELPLAMRVYSQANGARRCVQWQVFDGHLRMRSWEGSTSGGYSNVSAWRTVARNLVNTAGTPPFQLEGASSPYGSRLINVRLLVKTPDSGGQPIEVQSSLSGRNTQYGYNPGTCTPIPPA
ncbi:MAG: PilW family protein [Actinomycetes bacterium]